MIIPEGCEHGFQVLEADSELLYIHTAIYVPPVEGGFSCQDSQFGIRWPLPVADLSARDAGYLPVPTDFPGISS